MLRGMRKASSNWIGKTIMAVVMGVLILSFGLWGIADIFRGYGQSSLAKVGGTEISTEQFRQLFSERLQQFGRQSGRPLTADQARAFGLDRQILQQVIADAALDEEARRMKLGQSDSEVTRQITTDPTFRGPTGAFDPVRFGQIIRQAGYTEQRFIAEQSKLSLRRQIVGALIDGLQPPTLMQDALSRFQNEQRTIEYVKLGAAQAGAIDPPSPEALAGYYDDHKTQFRAPEYRKVAYAVLTPDAIAKWTDVSDEDAKKIFDKQRDKLGIPEKRDIKQMSFPSVEEAAAARARIEGGLSFDDLAKERNLTPADIDLGVIAKSAVIDPAVAEAAFSLPAEQVSQPVQGRFGVVLVRVGAIEPGKEASYESVAPQIKREIAGERARGQVQDLYKKMEDERGGGATVIDATKKIGISAVTIDAIDRSGRTPSGQPVTGLPPGTDLATPVFNSDVGVDNETISLKDGFLWFDVLGVTPSRERPLDEVRDQVEARWRADQVTSRLRTMGAELAKKLNDGGKLADEAATLNVPVETAANFKRDASVAGLPATAVQAAFATAKDSAGDTQGSDAEWVVFRLTGVTVPPLDAASPEAKQLKENLQRALGEEQVGAYVAKLQQDIGVTVNQGAFAQATGAASNN